MQLEPSNGDAYALQTVVAVALNDKEGALTNGRAAVERAPQSSASRVALSYALQANFELETARDVMEQAVVVNAEDGSAWARLAELRLMLDDVNGAADAARRATALSPQLARTHVVRGFVSLAQLKRSDAEEAFNQAIGLESDNPLARLGLGLAKIRRGRLSEGRSDLELAIALNPDDAILRSYLGKAYFEEKRAALAGEQFDMAKALGPLDPTAFFYDAIQKQTLNRPGEALADFQQSIELNANRAVYRSRFLLDEDLAARSASLGRLHRDLGFEQLALLEGWKSVEADPAEHSGHLFLADTYSALPRHEVARVSELLQAQLLQPISLTPVPPRLAATDLFILQLTGPDEQAYNEFNPLFNRNRLSVQVSGAFGENSLAGNEATVSGIWNRLSFSAGQFHYDTDGFRVNNQQDRDIYNVFVQTQLSSATSVQAEVRSEQWLAGDLTLLFDPENFAPDQAEKTTSSVARVGFRHVISPTSQIVVSVYRGSRDNDVSLSGSALGVTSYLEIRSQTESWTAEARHFLRAGPWRVTSGLGHFQANRDRQETFGFSFPGFPPMVTTDQFEDDPSQTNAYVYSILALQKAALTLGASGDFYRSQLFDHDQFNPKAGFSWNPYQSTTVRVTAFRTLHRALVSNQTIEPTHVAGFNQFFADAEAEAAVRYGIAVDQKVGRRIYAGAEYSWRNLQVPVQLETKVERFDRSEQFGRSYLYWLPNNRFSLSAGYLFERFDRTAASSLNEQILELRTHRIPLSVRYFAPSGLFASASTTYIRQRGEFANLAFLPAGEDRFWALDVALGYRLPNRYGRLALEIKNLLDEEFSFQDTDPGNPTVKPGRLALFTFTIGI